MPDAGNFDQAHGRDAVPGWSEAFAALPLETPDAGSWQRMQARLPATARSRTRLPLWFAAAASLLAAVGIAWRMQTPPTPDASMPTPSVAATSTPAQATVNTIDAAPAAPASVAHHQKPLRVPPSQRPIRTAAEPTGSTRVAKTETPATPPASSLEPLYAQSAQLETLLTMARDDRVASGTTAALSDTLDTQLATIDAALRNADLGDAQRAALWRERVDALQQLVGIETSNRLYAARGQSFDAALVRID